MSVSVLGNPAEYCRGVSWLQPSFVGRVLGNSINPETFPENLKKFYIQLILLIKSIVYLVPVRDEREVLAARSARLKRFDQTPFVCVAQIR